jgi:hypothetical protein
MIALVAVITAKNSAGVMHDFALYRGVAFEELFQIVMFVQVFLVVDQIWVVAQLSGDLGVVLQENVKLTNFVPEIAPGGTRRTEGYDC